MGEVGGNSSSPLWLYGILGVQSLVSFPPLSSPSTSLEPFCLWPRSPWCSVRLTTAESSLGSRRKRGSLQEAMKRDRKTGFRPRDRGSRTRPTLLDVPSLQLPSVGSPGSWPPDLSRAGCVCVVWKGGWPLFLTRFTGPSRRNVISFISSPASHSLVKSTGWLPEQRKPLVIILCEMSRRDSC